MSFRSGSYDRNTLANAWRAFCPVLSAERLEQVNLVELKQQGKRLILLDVDHTLVEWRAEEISPAVLAWIHEAKSLGFHICIISNTSKVQRLMRLVEKLEVDTVRGKLKPSREMYHRALEKFNCKPGEAVMIGDQLLTDILGANRSGVDAIWLKKMEGTEFIGTKFNRLIERLVSSRIYRAMEVTPEELEKPASGPLMERPIVRQFIKFCVVGGSSFVLDYCIRLSLLEKAQLGSETFRDKVGSWVVQNISFLFRHSSNYDAAFPVAATIAATVGILNSFLWNRLWTFRIKGKENRGEQLRRFVLVSVVGLGLNVIISSSLVHTLPFSQNWNARVGTVIAAGLVAIWNFAGQRSYAFKAKPQ
jgi:HAD superfamily phosphatase (TIGR01668 family)